MFNFKSLLPIALLTASGVASMNASANETALDAQQVAQLIEKADSYRLQDDSSKVVSLVRLYQDQELDKTRLYHVYTRPNRESLVVFKSAVEAGQKMLMMGDNYWLQMPKSRRPIRITPMQKLLGEASIGDISTLTWSQDYQGEWKATETVSVNGESVAAYHLALTAKTKGRVIRRSTYGCLSKMRFQSKLIFTCALANSPSKRNTDVQATTVKTTSVR